MLGKRNLIFDILLAGIIFLLAIIVLTLSSCKHDPDVIPLTVNGNTVTPENNGNNGNGGGNQNEESTCDPDTAYFQTQVLPLLISNCAKSGCHTSADHQDGVVLENYSSVINTGDIDAGRADHSDLYKVLIESDPDKHMPPPPLAPLTNEQTALIYNWIQQGGRNNSCQSGCDTSTVTFSGTIKPILQTYCAGCHSGSSPGGQIDLSAYAGVAAVANNGRLTGAVNHDPGFQPMPRGGAKLSDCKINQIRIWINNGAQND